MSYCKASQTGSPRSPLEIDFTRSSWSDLPTKCLSLLLSEAEQSAKPNFPLFSFREPYISKAPASTSLKKQDARASEPTVRTRLPARMEARSGSKRLASQVSEADTDFPPVGWCAQLRRHKREQRRRWPGHKATRGRASPSPWQQPHAPGKLGTGSSDYYHFLLTV